MFVKLIAQEKAQVAILDAYFPLWRDALETHTAQQWIDEWCRRTSVSDRTGRRWKAIAASISPLSSTLAA